MNIRYGNDLELTEWARSLTNQMAQVNALIRDGRLNAAFDVAESMTDGLEKLQFRINAVRFAK